MLVGVPGEVKERSIERSAGVSPAGAEASRSRQECAGRMPTPRRARCPRYIKASSLRLCVAHPKRSGGWYTEKVGQNRPSALIAQPSESQRRSEKLCAWRSPRHADGGII